MRGLFFVASAALPLLLGGCIAAVIGGAAAAAGHDRRPFTTVVEDKNIQLTAIDTLNHDKELALKNNVYVGVYQGVMLLFGEVRSEELKARAEKYVANIDGITRLVNDIAVQEPESFGSRRRDDLLTAQVKTALLDIVDMPGFDPTRINVSSAHRVVYLFGLVSEEEGERVVEIVRDVRGVEKVVKLFEYSDQPAAPRQ
jgi:osmotically-inducible protein OsmY